MTAKLTANADTAAYRRTFVDRNRIIKITDRRFHAAWEELRGGRLWITETVAGECVRARNFADLATIRVVPAQLCRTEPPGSMAAIDAAQEVWWIDGWQSATGIVGLRRLGAEQSRKRDALLRRMVPEHFACVDTDEVEQLADARIVAETVTLEEELLLSSNFNRLELDELNRWLRTHGPGTGQPTEGPIHLVDGYIKECMEQTEAGRTLGLKAVIAGFWPEDRSADEDEIIASAVHATARMGKKGAHLDKTGAYLADRPHRPAVEELDRPNHRRDESTRRGTDPGRRKTAPETHGVETRALCRQHAGTRETARRSAVEVPGRRDRGSR